MLEEDVGGARDVADDVKLPGGDCGGVHTFALARGAQAGDSIDTATGDVDAVDVVALV